jgi:hypothetical protein
MTAAERMFGIIKKALTFAIGTELFDTLRIGYLLLLNKDGIALPHLARDYLKLRHWIWVIKKATVCMRAHCASIEQSGAISTKQMIGTIFFCINNCIVVF